MADENDRELVHYGVRGMKWGKRKGRSGGSSDHTESRALGKKRISELSNAELKTLNTRRQLENQHRQLNPNAVTIGKKHVAAALATATTIAAIVKLAQGPAGKAAASATKKLINATMENQGRHVMINTVTSTARHLA